MAERLAAIVDYTREQGFSHFLQDPHTIEIGTIPSQNFFQSQLYTLLSTKPMQAI